MSVNELFIPARGRLIFKLTICQVNLAVAKRVDKLLSRFFPCLGEPCKSISCLADCIESLYVMLFPLARQVRAERNI